MKIFVTGLRGIPDVMGGVEIHCQELLPRIAAQRPDWNLNVVARGPYIGPKSGAYRGIRVRRLPNARSSALEAITSTASAIIYARLKRADLLHIHGIGPGFLTPVARLMGLKVVVTYHSRNYDHQKWGRFAREVLKLGESVSIRFAQKIIVVAEWILEDLRQNFPSHAAKMVYIPNGAPELPASSGTSAASAQLKQGYILYVGRIVQEKGLATLIDAFKRAETGRTLVVAGAADHESEYSRQVVREAGPDVVFLGPQPRSELGALYRGAGLFVLPSFQEGLPLAAIEAASCGTPVLMSDIPAARDLGLANAHYFPTGDVAALAMRLRQPFPELPTAEVNRIVRQFDWSQSARMTERVYLEAAFAKQSATRLAAQHEEPCLRPSDLS